MGLSDDLKGEVGQIFKEQWNATDGYVVPDPEDIGHGNEARKLVGAVLYSDLIDSTGMVNEYGEKFCAEVYKAFLRCASKIITKNKGDITAFDGDRIMAVFLGLSKEINAVNAAKQIEGAIIKIINPAIKFQYPKTLFVANQVCGIDTSSLFVARTGYRTSNDLVWVGKAANFAAKLSQIREPLKSTWITEEVFNYLNEQPSNWVKATYHNRTVYSSTYYRDLE
jgi:class 3 adenylate cyclase